MSLIALCCNALKGLPRYSATELYILMYYVSLCLCIYVVLLLYDDEEDDLLDGGQHGSIVQDVTFTTPSHYEAQSTKLHVNQGLNKLQFITKFVCERQRQ